METKKCSKCGIEKSLTEFYKDPNDKNGVRLRPKCKACLNEERKSWGKKNRDKLAQYAREWRKENPGCKRSVMSRKARNSNSKFKHLHGSVARYFPELTSELLEELFDGKCYLCGKTIEEHESHIEHKIPFAKGGTNDIKNVGFTCEMCNKLKGKLTPDEFMIKLDKILDNYKHLCH
jgi:5-methylcytosine-specific restriction endonuclease McrA